MRSAALLLVLLALVHFVAGAPAFRRLTNREAIQSGLPLPMPRSILRCPPGGCDEATLEAWRNRKKRTAAEISATPPDKETNATPGHPIESDDPGNSLELRCACIELGSELVGGRSHHHCFPLVLGTCELERRGLERSLVRRRRAFQRFLVKRRRIKLPLDLGAPSSGIPPAEQLEQCYLGSILKLSRQLVGDRCPLLGSFEQRRTLLVQRGFVELSLNFGAPPSSRLGLLELGCQLLGRGLFQRFIVFCGGELGQRQHHLAQHYGILLGDHVLHHHLDDHDKGFYHHDNQGPMHHNDQGFYHHHDQGTLHYHHDDQELELHDLLSASASPSACAFGPNWQQYTAGIAGILAPPVCQQGDKWYQSGQQYNFPIDAINQSCYVQMDKCQLAANQGGNKAPLTVANCNGPQIQACLAQAQQTQYTDGIAGILAPPVCKSGDKWYQSGQAYNFPIDAINQSCYVQMDKCQLAANQGGNKSPLTVANCNGPQIQACLARGQATVNAGGPGTSSAAASTTSTSSAAPTTTSKAASSSTTTSSSAPAASSSASACATGGNWQQYTAGIADIYAPPVCQDGKYWYQSGQRYNFPIDAINQSCYVQMDKCQLAANRSGNKSPLTVANCNGPQIQACLQQAKVTVNKGGP
ncbi:hypothetical protein Q8F55_008193 [Vanrija albida]|uniref:Uncharacterized protein n=1 Tax=Vanrija albida TaxID=181172 RepID=A0ABR3PVP9_9TREE